VRVESVLHFEAVLRPSFSRKTLSSVSDNLAPNIPGTACSEPNSRLASLSSNTWTVSYRQLWLRALDCIAQNLLISGIAGTLMLRSTGRIVLRRSS